jgi:acyl-coenzyme A synthetase/AMP-(fatty) acid ligase/acyl carrier protein
MHDADLPTIDLPVNQFILTEGLSVGEAKFALDAVVIPGSRTLGGSPRDDDWTVVWDFAIDIFSRAEVQSLADRFLADLEDLVGEEAGTPTVSGGAVLQGESDSTSSQRSELASFLNFTKGDPEALAYVETSGDGSVTVRTYSGFDNLIEITRRGLVTSGVRNGDLVVAQVGRGLQAAALQIAVLREGAAFCPVGVDLEASDLLQLARGLGAAFIAEKSSSSGAVRPTEFTRQDYSGIAYVLNTSGTTGSPKAVAVTRDSVAASLKGVITAYGLAATDRVIQFAVPSFDVAIEELLPTLASGGCCVNGHAEMYSARQFAELVYLSEATVVNVPTSYVRYLYREMVSDFDLVASLSSVRLVVVGSEVVDQAAVDAVRHLFPSARILSAYGVTEGGTTSVVADLTSVSLGRGVPAGAPIGGAGVAVLNSDFQSARVGELGEVVLFGSGVTNKYVRHGELSPVSERSQLIQVGAVIRTGDLGLIDDSGCLWLDGRIDAQVKVFGVSVDLEQVGQTLADALDVDSAVCVVDRGHGAELCAVVAGGSESIRRGRAAMQKLSLRQQRPSSWLPVESIPRLPGSLKIDRIQLERLALSGARATDRATNDLLDERPDSVELRIADVMANLLGFDELGQDDDFFERGGHSLAAVQLAALLEQSLGVHVSISAVFEGRSARGIARLVG